MENINIKIEILNRPYTLSVMPEEEAQVRQAASVLQQRLKDFRDRYQVQDPIDLMAMTALAITTDSLRVAESKEVERPIPSASEHQTASIEADFSAIMDGLLRLEQLVLEGSQRET